MPVVVALNMMDMANQRGIKIDVDHLQTHLGCPVVRLWRLERARRATLYGL